MAIIIDPNAGWDTPEEIREVIEQMYKVVSIHPTEDPNPLKYIIWSDPNLILEDVYAPEPLFKITYVLETGKGRAGWDYVLCHNVEEAEEFIEMQRVGAV